MTTAQLMHLVLFPTYFWGHARPMSTLAARMVKLRPNVVITFLALKGLRDRVVAEVARDFLPGEEQLAKRIRIIALEETSEPQDTSGAPGAFEAAWDRLRNGQPLVCAKTGKRFEALSVPPSAILLDFFSVDAFDTVRQTSGDAVKLYSWFAIATNSFFHAFVEDRYPAAVAEAARTGRPLEEIAFEMMWPNKGEVIHSPCLPPVYDYEIHPQEFPLPQKLFGTMMAKLPRVMNTTDGLVTFDAADYHPEATAAVKQYYKEKSRKATYTGPLLPQASGVQARANEKAQANGDSKVMAFLDEKLKSAGKHSVLYLSFGSLFWPSDPAKLWAVVDVLIETNTPFVMSYGALMASPMPEEVKARIERFGNALVADWVPQQALLDHPATGWYLMHGGHNGTLESVAAGVPMIVWPIAADQPLNALYLSDIAHVAYELVEVRSGRGLRKLYRSERAPVGTIEAVKEEMRGVLAQAFGADGAEKRARLQAMKAKLQTAWDEDGVARRDVSDFLDGL